MIPPFIQPLHSCLRHHMQHTPTELAKKWLCPFTSAAWSPLLPNSSKDSVSVKPSTTSSLCNSSLCPWCLMSGWWSRKQLIAIEGRASGLDAGRNHKRARHRRSSSSSSSSCQELRTSRLGFQTNAAAATTTSTSNGSVLPGSFLHQFHGRLVSYVARPRISTSTAVVWGKCEPGCSYSPGAQKHNNIFLLRFRTRVSTLLRQPLLQCSILKAHDGRRKRCKKAEMESDIAGASSVTVRWSEFRCTVLWSWHCGKVMDLEKEGGEREVCKWTRQSWHRWVFTFCRQDSYHVSLWK